MERLAQKIKKDERLFLRDLKVWIGYNFLVFSSEEQEKIRKLNERQIWFWKYLTLLSIPYWMGCYAVARYHFKWGGFRSAILSFGFIAGLSQVGLLSSNSDMRQLYGDLYSKYQFEVLSPKYRGLKLKTGRKVYQIDD